MWSSHTIADVYSSREHTFDSSVYLFQGTNERKIVKIYDLLGRGVIEDYHRIHNELSKQSYLIFPERTEDILMIQNYYRSKIDRIFVEVLNLGDDIFTASDIHYEHEIIVTEVPYIKWENLLNKGLLSDHLLLQIENRILYPDIEKQTNFEVEDTNIGMNGLLKSIKQLWELERPKFLTPMNMKVRSIEWDTLSIVITDLWNSIGKLVRHFRSEKKK